MAYTVLARKYRSRTFDEVIGQEPIATTLVNAIKTGRIHHGYLFTGSRGTGKTSMARILAKALNCLSATEPTVTPCCQCAACLAIAEGQDLDVIEIDAASNTGVDNIRELRSNTAYRPARARYKVYIIDEVHMLSTGAFNALLKTLEEPPDHVKFILATTEVQKVPATIQSRCQRFNFRNISPEAIAGRLAGIAKEEGAEAEPAALRRVARLANGSMRDALSILDQLLSVAPQKVTADVLDEILPPAQDEQVFRLFAQAADGDVAAALGQVDAILTQGRGLEVFCNDAIDLVRTLMLLRACGPDAPMVDVPAGARDEYLQLSERFELSQYVQMIALLEELRRNVRYSGAGRALTDAVIVRLARMHAWAPIEQLLGELSGGGDGTEAKRTVGSSADEKKKSPPPLEPRAAVAERSARAAARPAVPGPLAPMPARVSAPVSARPAPRASAPSARPLAAATRDTAVECELHEADVPDDNVPAEAATDRAAAATPASVSSEDRKRVLEDPVVRQTLELFDAVLVNVKRRPDAPTPEPAE